MGLICHERIRIPKWKEIDIGVVPDAIPTEAERWNACERGDHIGMEHVVVQLGGLEVFDEEHEVAVSAQAVTREFDGDEELLHEGIALQVAQIGAMVAKWGGLGCALFGAMSGAFAGQHFAVWWISDDQIYGLFHECDITLSITRITDMVRVGGEPEFVGGFSVQLLVFRIEVKADA